MSALTYRPDQTSALTYRPDIDGLRAVSVLGVLYYHYGFAGLRGGFTGVDVFFVISGFLITSILYRDIQDRRFSLLSFYARRVRRILPALLVMLAVSIIAGFAMLYPDEYIAFAKSAVFAALGISNLYFRSNTGYFDQAAELSPLLHTWSLGVEEQFYVVWPGLLFLILLGLRKRLFVVIGIALFDRGKLRGLHADRRPEGTHSIFLIRGLGSWPPARCSASFRPWRG